MTSRLLFVHAHPDDETIATGVAIAHHVAAGDEVHVLTCTLGEQGEVIPPELAHLAADAEDALGPYRRDELDRAMAVLGARHRLLGEGSDGAPRYRDSGMAGTPSAQDERAFSQADLDDAASLVRDAVDDITPDVVVTYDEHGGYAHPDHIQTHRVVRAALSGLSKGDRPRLFAILTPRSWAEEDRSWLAERGPAMTSWSLPAGDFPPSVVADDLVTHAVEDEAARVRQISALREHPTQVTVVGDQMALSNDIAARISGREGYAEIDIDSGRPLPGVPGEPRRPLVEARR